MKKKGFFSYLNLVHTLVNLSGISQFEINIKYQNNENQFSNSNSNIQE